MNFDDYTYVPVDISSIARNDFIVRSRGMSTIVYRAKNPAKWHRGEEFKLSCERMNDRKAENLYFVTGQSVAKLFKIEELAAKLAAAEVAGYPLGQVAHAIAPPNHLLVDEAGDVAARTKAGAMAWIRVGGKWARLDSVHIYQWLCKSNPLERVWRIVNL